MAAKKRQQAAKLRSAAFRRIRADHQAELAGDYVELIADLIDETLQTIPSEECASIEAVREADRRARAFARAQLAQHGIQAA